MDACLRREGIAFLLCIYLTRLPFVVSRFIERSETFAKSIVRYKLP